MSGLGKPSGNPDFKTVPIRGTKRQRTASSSPSRSRSPTKGDDEFGKDDEVPDTIISVEEARPIIAEFRQSVIAAGDARCAVSRRGTAWWATGGAGGAIGPAVQAAHVIPQVHWNVFPVGIDDGDGDGDSDDDRGIAAEDDLPALREAWEQTWHWSNGLLLLSHLHQCFDARLLSIDPDTRRVRAFVPYDAITEHHGKGTSLPPEINLGALRHHYDMCCIENMAANKQPGSLSTILVSNLARNTLPAVSDMKTSSQQRSQRDSSGQGGVGEVGQEGRTGRPLSPPLSDLDGGQKGPSRIWRFGGSYLTGAQDVARLRQKGWLIYDVESDAEDSGRVEEQDDWTSDNKERGRPRKRQCVELARPRS
ncbi:hypothetical protein B0H67DRAFT_571154 [Lasiosphaeris hirsuta]|uniref:HNH nuclease domain-containing protein n=1 Tax=Lasiosphaeris hirsuta TaxID=260670 RepID=A0AA40E6E2_9PEZI|nr:hypothetical protein B0H67DRAFT_571154 [Lasiosphaeris hirsuta]